MEEIKDKVDHRAELEKQEKEKDQDFLNEYNLISKKYGRSLAGHVTFLQGKNPIWGLTVVRNGNVS